VSAGRIAIIGNAGGGKSTLARAMAARRGLPLTEVDKLL
jgi:adenylate kinase family enzyme